MCCFSVVLHLYILLYSSILILKFYALLILLIVIVIKLFIVLKVLLKQFVPRFNILANNLKVAFLDSNVNVCFFTCLNLCLGNTSL